MIKNQPDKEEILEAIREGVQEAFLQAMECSIGYRESLRDDLLTMIEEGVRKAFSNEIPSERTILESIDNSVGRAFSQEMPSEEAILKVIKLASLRNID